jgi:hypothetical protein
MRDAIVDKLRTTLAGAIDDECKVLYVVAEARKLLEKYPVDPAPFALKLYFHWALHIDLSHQATTRPFLERVDAYVESVLAGSVNIVEEHRMLRDFVLFDTFRSQFIQFLTAYDLPQEICEQEPRWNEFLKNYSGIIEDGSLSCRAGNNFKFITDVVFTKGQSREGEYVFPFDMSWRIGLLDGRTMTVDVSASQHAYGKMISNKITLLQPGIVG